MLPALAEMQLSGESDDTVRSIVFPQREAMARMYRELAAAGGFRTDIPAELPNDILVGALLYRLLYSGRVPDADEAQAIVDVVLDGIRVRRAATRSPPSPARLRVDDNAAMHFVAVIAALVAALIHVWFFVLESLQFDQPKVFGRFGITSAEDAAIVRPMAFNQGFYNLFLALGILGGLGFVATGRVEAGRAVVLFACACMVGAGAVLLATNRRFLIGSLVQAVPPLVAIVAGLLLAP